MQTNLAAFIKDTPEGREADAILRKCVHCGFCTATCPTYQLLGDELDGPRGRIYLIKEVLEGAVPTAQTQLHLDRCLQCRSCETTCPSGVQYGRLLDIGRPIVDERVGRGPLDTAQRVALRALIPRRALFSALVGLGRLVRPLMPAALAKKLPLRRETGAWPVRAHARRMLVLESCGQRDGAPDTNAAAARVLDRLGIALARVPQAGCCGAVAYHLNAQADGLDAMRRNINAWWPEIEAGVEAIVVTASGCGTMVKDYGHLFAHDAAYAAKAARVSALAKDLLEVIEPEQERLKALLPSSLIPHPSSFAFHPPCTLQHGLKLKGRAESLLAGLGFTLTPVANAHLCCGSAGTYSLTQPELSQQLLANKIAALEAGAPAAILTANIGCQLHLQSATGLPVRHWIEALDERLA